MANVLLLYTYIVNCTNYSSGTERPKKYTKTTLQRSFVIPFLLAAVETTVVYTWFTANVNTLQTFVEFKGISSTSFLVLIYDRMYNIICYFKIRSFWYAQESFFIAYFNLFIITCILYLCI